MVKVLHIIDSLRQGGAEKIVKELIEHQPDVDSPDYEHHLFVLRSAQPQYPFDPLRTEVMKSFTRYSFAPLARLTSRITDENFRILHCHLLRSKAFGWWLKRRRFPDRILVMHEHGGSAYSSPLSPASITMRLIGSAADRIVAVSQVSASLLTLRTGIPPSRIDILQNPVAPSAAVDGLRRPVDGRFRLGFIGRLEPVKGCDILLEALRHVPADIQLAIAGVGSQERRLRRMAEEKDLSARVEFLGFVENIPALLQTLDAMVVPSRYEACPGAILESHAAGVPVIAHDVGGIKEVVRDGIDGLLVDPGDARRLAEGILRLRNDPSLRERLAAGGRSRAAGLSHAVYFARLHTIYAKLMSGIAIR